MAERRYNKPWSGKNRPWLLKWRPPERHERDLRVIDGQQHVWNPNRRGWEKTGTHVTVKVNATSQYHLRTSRGHSLSNHGGDRRGRVRTSPDRTRNRHREPSERYASPEQGSFGDESMRRDRGTRDSPIVVEVASDLDHDHDHHQHKQQRDDDSPCIRKRKRVSFCVDDECESMVADKGSQAATEHASTSTSTSTSTRIKTNNATTNSPPLSGTDAREWRHHLQRSLDENNMLSEKFRELREKYENKCRAFEELTEKHSEQSKVLDTVHQSKNLLLRSNETKEAALNARIQALEEKLSKRGPQGSSDEMTGHRERYNTATSDQPKANCTSEERAQTEKEPSENQKLLAQLETTTRELAAANQKVASFATELGKLRGQNTELSNELASQRTTLEAVRAEKEETEANLEDLQYDNGVYAQRLAEVMLRVGKLEARDRTRKASLEKCQKELEQARKKEAATTVKEPPKEEHKPNKEVDNSRMELEENYAKLQNDFNTLAMQVARQSRTIEEQHQELRRWNERVGPHGMGGGNPGMPLKIED